MFTKSRGTVLVVFIIRIIMLSGGSILGSPICRLWASVFQVYVYSEIGM